MKKKLLAAIFGATLVLGACGGGNDTSDEADTGSSGDSVVVDAEAVVNQKCITCHGGNLEGASAPAINKAGADYSEEEIKGIIQNGKGGMPSIKMKDAEAEAVASWLAEKK